MTRITIQLFQGGWSDIAWGIALGWVTAGALVCLHSLACKPKEKHVR